MQSIRTQTRMGNCWWWNPATETQNCSSGRIHLEVKNAHPISTVHVVVAQRGNCLFCKFYTVHCTQKKRKEISARDRTKERVTRGLADCSYQKHSRSFPEGQSPPHNSYPLTKPRYCFSTPAVKLCAYITMQIIVYALLGPVWTSPVFKNLVFESWVGSTFIKFLKTKKMLIPSLSQIFKNGRIQKPPLVFFFSQKPDFRN